MVLLLMHCHGYHCLPRHQHHFRFFCYHFLVVCTCAASASATVAADAIVNVVAARHRCPLLLPLQPGDVQNITFKVIF